MSKENLQTIIVSKSIAPTRNIAEKLARPHALSIKTSRETGSSWRFRQRPVGDFVDGSFKSFPLPQQPGIILVYGMLKRSKNPADQRWLQFKEVNDNDLVLREWDFWMAFESVLRRIKDAKGLKDAISVAEKRNIKTPIIRGLIIRAIADRARSLDISNLSDTSLGNQKIYNLIKNSPNINPDKISATNGVSRSFKKLKSPKTMPDPGPCAWIGSMVEWAWVLKNGESSKKVSDNGSAIWEPGSEWMFAWSPMYKAIVSIKLPKDMYKLAKVSRYGNAAKMFEVFTARPAENTFEVKVPDVKLVKLGSKASHIVYRSDKWSPKRLESDYIHELGKGVQLYCGPSIEKPEVFICFGGKLTLTKRGLVW